LLDDNANNSSDCCPILGEKNHIQINQAPIVNTSSSEEEDPEIIEDILEQQKKEIIQKEPDEV
jgi:hypothetical protein